MPCQEPTDQLESGRGNDGTFRELWERPCSTGVMLLEPGQPVVWTYRTQVPPCQIHFVEAEVVQVGRLRARIRLRDSEGRVLLRWVKPERLRPKQVNETLLPYPVQRMLT